LFGKKVRRFSFFSKTTRRIWPNVFLGLGENTWCVEKHCYRPIRIRRKSIQIRDVEEEAV